MRVSNYIAECLLHAGTTDVFGIPGGVILDVLYAFEATDGISPHLSYHEQAAGFAACGYAQSSGRLGVAYATRGPGFTNLVTPIADAFCDSIPVLFLTAHAGPCPPYGMRVFGDQEMDTCAMVERVTKFAMRVDSPDDFPAIFSRACRIALSGRKGPVFLDVAKSVLSAEIDDSVGCEIGPDMDCKADAASCAREFVAEIGKAKRPVVLVGDGVDRAAARDALLRFAECSGLPFLSSRFSHDLLAGSHAYYGYVGSHGIRAANFILSKADLVLTIGNRLNFPPQSPSFSALASRTRFVRHEIDASEFARPVPNCRNVMVDANGLIAALAEGGARFPEFVGWLAVCDRLRDELAQCDVNDAVLGIRALLDSTPRDAVVVGDVGNCEFWLSRASVLHGANHRTLYSKSFGALGCGLGKAIGAHYATGRPVVCVVGDQGLMLNLQELQYIAQHRLPVTVVVVDNHASGMIRDVECRRFNRLLHVTPESGFSVPDWRKVFSAFGIEDFQILEVPSELKLAPYLLQGDAVQRLSPPIPADKFDVLDRL